MQKTLGTNHGNPRINQLPPAPDIPKNMKKMIHALVYIVTTTAAALGGIALEWEYSFNGKDIGLPDTQFQIFDVKIAPSGHSLLYIGSDFTDAGEKRFVMLDPQGKQIWLSENLSADFIQKYPTIIHVSAGAAMFATGTNTLTDKVFVYNQNASPALSSINLTLETLAMISGFAVNPPTSIFSPTAFFTRVLVPGKGSTTLRKYRLDAVSSTPVVAESVSGVDSTNFVIRWGSVVNILYQVQESPDLLTWTNVGVPVTGNGSGMAWSTPIVNTSKFYRITQP